MYSMFVERKFDQGGINMEYVGFILLMMGAAGMDSNVLIGGIMALAGVAMIAIKSAKGNGGRDYD